MDGLNPFVKMYADGERSNLGAIGKDQPQTALPTHKRNGESHYSGSSPSQVDLTECPSMKHRTPLPQTLRSHHLYGLNQSLREVSSIWGELRVPSEEGNVLRFSGWDKWVIR